MARRRKGDRVHGWVIVDKPLGLSSNAVVGKVRRAFNAQKAGHGGTLDPLATGILPIALGEATKTMSYVMDGAKAYRFTIEFGTSTTTDDAEGETTESSDVRPTNDQIDAALSGFMGVIDQIPPAFSAIKINGERAYKLAREGVEVEMKTRQVTIKSLTVTERADDDHVTLEVACTKGTYVRSLARDLARALGTVGHVSMLRRIQAGPFDEKSAILLEKLETLGHSAPLVDVLLPVETALDDIPALAISEVEAGHLRHGRAIPLGSVNDQTPIATLSQGGPFAVLSNGQLVALACLVDGEIRPTRVINP